MNAAAVEVESSAQADHRNRPRILVTMGRDLPDRSNTLRLPVSYVTALLAEGAIPVLMPPGLDSAAVNDFVQGVDGLLLPGGVDPHPRYFDEDVHPMTLIDEELDALEFATIEAVRRERLPMLGICRGSQVMNVAFGGSLIQHLETSPIDHKPDGPLNRHIHLAKLVEGTRLRALSGVDELRVNSWHHQAVGRVGDGLKVAAVAEDGVIEAVESIDPDTWIVGVQYHPEEMSDGKAHRSLLTDFVAAAQLSRLPALPSLSKDLA